MREEADVGNVCVCVFDSCWQLSRLQMSVCLSLLLALLFCSKKGRAVLNCVVGCRRVVYTTYSGK